MSMSSTELLPDRAVADEIIRVSSSQVEPVLRAAVNTLPETTRHIAGYHLGWWDENSTTDPVAPKGKAIRPTLVLLSAHATGAEPAGKQVLAAAAAVELVHNSSLLHDDVIDNDHTRRHRPTAWSIFGAGNAILAGDALLALAGDLLAGEAARTSAAASRLLHQAVQALLDGQCLDLALETHAEVDPAGCERMSMAKTGRLMGCASGIGCLVAEGEDQQVASFVGFGEKLGLAFQHVDDLLGIWGDPAATGKPIYSDLRNRKKSLPIVYALTSDSAAGRELAERFKSEPTSHRDFYREASLVEESGGREWSAARADDLVAAALSDLRRAVSDESAAAHLVALAERIVHRDR